MWQKCLRNQVELWTMNTKCIICNKEIDKRPAACFCKHVQKNSIDFGKFLSKNDGKELFFELSAESGPLKKPLILFDREQRSKSGLKNCPVVVVVVFVQ